MIPLVNTKDSKNESSGTILEDGKIHRPYFVVTKGPSFFVGKHEVNWKPIGNLAPR